MMKRGRFSAWPYVVLAFLGQIAMCGLIPALLIGLILNVAGVRDDVMGVLVLLIGGGAGIGGAYLTYRDRWRCNEAFSSRFCSGLMNLSLLYVPAIAFVYGNVRGVQKLFGK
jgi:hypothetical protein